MTEECLIHIQHRMLLKRDAGERYIIKLFMPPLWPLTISLLSGPSRGLRAPSPQRVREKSERRQRGVREARGGVSLT